MIEAIVFDFDGLIIDTETPEFDTWQEVFESYGVLLEREVWEWAIGRHNSDFNIYKHLAELCGQPIEPEEVRPRRRRRYLELVDQNPVLPGVEDYLDTAKAMGMKLAVASSSAPDWAEGNLKSRELLHHFEFVLDAGDVEHAKPAPDLYTMAVDMLGVRPENALAIEDSMNGLTAAKAAGLYCVVVPNPMTERMKFDAADMRLASLASLPLDALLAELDDRDRLNGASMPNRI